ncbi:MAG: isochorismatase family cysteine hydrolase [Solirubrobacterales bacterium]
MSLIVGQPVVIAVDPQQGGSEPGGGIPADMPGRAERGARMIKIVDRARELGVPVVFIQEVHKRSLVEIGRELDGAEGPHCFEDDPKNDFIEGLDPRPEEFHIKKRRYSAFFGTELEIVLKGYGAETLILFGGLTDVCVHYTAVDAHQHDYRVRVAKDAVGGSSQRAHDAALEAIEYLQSGSLASTDELIAAMEEWASAREPATT